MRPAIKASLMGGTEAADVYRSQLLAGDRRHLFNPVHRDQYRGARQKSGLAHSLSNPIVQKSKPGHSLTSITIAWPLSEIGQGRPPCESVSER